MFIKFFFFLIYFQNQVLKVFPNMVKIVFKDNLTVTSLIQIILLKILFFVPPATHKNTSKNLTSKTK